MFKGARVPRVTPLAIIVLVSGFCRSTGRGKFSVRSPGAIGVQGEVRSVSVERVFPFRVEMHPGGARQGPVLCRAQVGRCRIHRPRATWDVLLHGHCHAARGGIAGERCRAGIIDSKVATVGVD